MKIKRAYLIAVFILLTACEKTPEICDEDPLLLANKVAQACFRGGGSCMLDGWEFPLAIGQVGLDYYKECGQSLKLQQTLSFDDRKEFLYRCAGSIYSAELRVTVLNVPSKSFGCSLAFLNFYLTGTDVLLGSLTRSQVQIMERYPAFQ